MIVQCPACHLRHDVDGRPPGTVLHCRCGGTTTVPEPGGETVALTCPQCGGQADHKLARCRHCDSALATIRCPACFGLAFEGNRHCAHCGETLDAPARVTHSNGHAALPCPVCQTDLGASIVDKTLIDGCSDCGGVWLDHHAFEQILTTRHYADLVEMLNIPAYRQGKPVYERDNRETFYVRCPVCEEFMHRRNYARTSGIVLDVCAAHGIWFDANELSKVLAHGAVAPTETNTTRLTARPSTAAPARTGVRPVPIRLKDQFDSSWPELIIRVLLAIFD